ALDTITLTIPMARSYGARALIWVSLTKLMGAGLPLIDTVTSARVVGNTPPMMASSHVAARVAELAPEVVVHCPLWIAPEVPPAALPIPRTAGRPLVAVDAGTRTHSAV